MEAVIFDLNGVLFDTSTYLHEAYKKSLELVGIEYSFEEFCKNYGLRTRDHLRKVLVDRGKEFDNKILDDLFNLRHDLFLKGIKKEKINLCPGSLELLDELKKKGIKIGLCSAMHRNNLEFLLKKLDIYEYFNAIVSADDVERGKPGPEPYLKSCNLLGTNPKNCIGIEDTDIGLESLKVAGMKSIVVIFTNKIKYDFSKADLIINNLEDLNFEILSKLI